MTERYDFAIVGGGIIGTATAWRLKQRDPTARIVLIEKEPAIGVHQTGRNSGVIHAGVYYTPGSLKARFCAEGVRRTVRFCRDNDIAFEQCGKLIVATDDAEESRLEALFERAHQNGLKVEWLDKDELEGREPNIRGVAAVLSRTSGIVNYREIARVMSRRFTIDGGTVALGQRVSDLREKPNCVEVITDDTAFTVDYLIACGGLQADRLAKMQDIDPGVRIVPYRGEYYRLRDELSDVVRHLIYPVPDLALPFLGVHLTRMIDGSITIGPNALQGWKREGYGRINISLRDTRDLLTYAGFWRATKRHFAAGLRELRQAWSTRYFLDAVRRYCPSLTIADLEPWPAGVRAMAVDRQGNLVDDFLFAESARSLHVLNAPSPAATSAIPIADHICDRIDRRISGDLT